MLWTVGSVPTLTVFCRNEELGERTDWKKRGQNVNTGFVEEVWLDNFDFILIYFLNWL